MHSTGITDRYGKELISTIDFTGHTATGASSLSANKVVFVTASPEGPYFNLSAGEGEDTINITLEPGDLISGITISGPGTADDELVNLSDIKTVSLVPKAQPVNFIRSGSVYEPYIELTSSTDDANTAVLQVKNANLIQVSNEFATELYTTNRLTFRTLSSEGPYLEIGPSADSSLLIGIGAGELISGITLVNSESSNTLPNIKTLVSAPPSAVTPFATTGDPLSPYIEVISTTGDSTSAQLQLKNCNSLQVRDGTTDISYTTNCITFRSSTTGGPSIQLQESADDGLLVTLEPGNLISGISLFPTITENAGGGNVYNIVHGKTYLSFVSDYFEGPFVETFNGYNSSAYFRVDETSIDTDVNVVIKNCNNLQFSSNPNAPADETYVTNRLTLKTSVPFGPWITLEESDNHGLLFVYGGGWSTIPIIINHPSGGDSIVVDNESIVYDRDANPVEWVGGGNPLHPVDTYHLWDGFKSSSACYVDVNLSSVTGLVNTAHVVVDLRNYDSTPSIVWSTTSIGKAIKWLYGDAPTIVAGKLHLISFQLIGDDSYIIGNLSYAI